MGSSCHPSAAALGMTFFQQMCQLVAVLGMHHHLKALAGFDRLVATQLPLYAPVLDGALAEIWSLTVLADLRTALFTCVEASVAYSFKPSLMASAISSMLTVLLIRLPPFQSAMNLQDLLLIVHRVNGFDIVELISEADAVTC